MIYTFALKWLGFLDLSPVLTDQIPIPNSTQLPNEIVIEAFSRQSAFI